MTNSMTNSTTTQVLLLDVGGVLVDLTGGSKMYEWTGRRWSISALKQRWLQSPTVRAFETGQCGPEEFAQAIVAEMPLAVSPADFLREYSTWLHQLFPGVAELLTDLRERYTLASLSNTNVLHWPRVRDEMRLGAMLHHHFPSHETGLIKPDADAFEQVVEALDVPAAAISFFDDNQLNVDAAAALGIRARKTVGVDELVSALDSLGLRG